MHQTAYAALRPLVICTFGNENNNYVPRNHLIRSKMFYRIIEKMRI